MDRETRRSRTSAASHGGAAALLFVAALWSGSFVASKVALRDLTPLAVAFARFALASLAFAPVVAVYRRRGHHLGQRDVKALAPLAFLGVTSYFWVQYTALRYTTAINVGLAVATSPVFAALVGRLVLFEPIGRLTGAGIAVALLGAALVATGGRMVPDLSRGWPDALGVGLGLVNAAAWGAFTALGRRAVARYPPLFATAWIAILGTAMMAPILAVTGDFAALTRLGASVPALLAVGYLGLLCSVAGYSLWYRALARIPTAAVASFLYLQPPMTAVMAYFVLGEGLGVHTAAGGVLVIAGVYLANRPEAG
ncbi:MAG: DMT family transporter [Acetobacteraceae bacterium]|nr:DMT family transporter [Acetobacteraceae bacterium]